MTHDRTSEMGDVKQTRSVFKTSKTTRESHECRETATERFEKKTSRSKVRKTRLVETWEPRPSGQDLQSEKSRPQPSPQKSSRAGQPWKTDPRPADPPPKSSRDDWHTRMPENVKLSLDGVTKAGCGCTGAVDFDGDYILALTERTPQRCRWEFTFPAKSGLHRLALEATPHADGTLRLRAVFEGSVQGPEWVSAGIRELTRLRLNLHQTPNLCAGHHWPQMVEVLPLQTPLPRGSFYISPEPTVAEAVMLSSGFSSDSSGSSGGSTTKPTKIYNPGTATGAIVLTILGQGGDAADATAGMNVAAKQVGGNHFVASIVHDADFDATLQAEINNRCIAGRKGIAVIIAGHSLGGEAALKRVDWFDAKIRALCPGKTPFISVVSIDAVSSSGNHPPYTTPPIAATERFLNYFQTAEAFRGGSIPSADVDQNITFAVNEWGAAQNPPETNLHTAIDNYLAQESKVEGKKLGAWLRAEADKLAAKTK